MQPRIDARKRVLVYRSDSEAGGIRTKEYFFRILCRGQAAAFPGAPGEFALVADKKLPRFASRAPLSGTNCNEWGKIGYWIDCHEGGRMAISQDYFPRGAASSVFGIGSYFELLASNDLSRSCKGKFFTSTYDASKERLGQIAKGGLQPCTPTGADAWMRGIANVVLAAVKKDKLQRRIELLAGSMLGRFTGLSAMPGFICGLAYNAVGRASRRGRLDRLEALVERLAAALQAKAPAPEAKSLQ